jgi:hypothetical protein
VLIERCSDCDLNWLFLGRGVEDTAELFSPLMQLPLDAKRALD